MRTTNHDTMPENLGQLIARLDAAGIRDSRRYDAVRKFLNFKARGRGIPISGSFELTPLCNLDCKMCYVHLNEKQMGGTPLLSPEQWKGIMEQAIDAGMLYARLTGGECLTYDGFRELYRFLRERGIETVILTNGLLLNENMTAFLRKYPPAAIQVSLYGGDDDAYERVTGRRVFSRVLENLRRVKKAGIPLTVAVTPSDYMTDGEQILRLLWEEKLPFQINAGIFPPRSETGRSQAEASPDTYISMLRLCSWLKGRELPPGGDPAELPDPGGNRGRAPVGVTCGAGRSGFAIDWRGNMRPCNNFPCGGENVPALGFREAWRRIHDLAIHFPIPVECQECAYQRVCKHCVAEHAAGAPIGHASPAICAQGRRIVKEGIRSLEDTL